MQTPRQRQLAQIQRKLDRWELEHLRELAAQQCEQIEDLQRRLADAEASLDFWHGHALDLGNTLHDSGAGQIGLTRAGEVLILPPAPEALHVELH